MAKAIVTHNTDGSGIVSTQVDYNSDGKPGLSSDSEKVSLRKGIEEKKINPKNIVSITLDAGDGGGPASWADIAKAKAAANGGAPGARPVGKNPAVRLFSVVQLDGKRVTPGTFEVADEDIDGKLGGDEEKKLIEKIRAVNPKIDEDGGFNFGYVAVNGKKEEATRIGRRVDAGQDAGEEFELGPDKPEPKMVKVEVTIKRSGTTKENKNKPPKVTLSVMTDGLPGISRDDAKNALTEIEKNRDLQDSSVTTASTVTIDGETRTWAELTGIRDQSPDPVTGQDGNKFPDQLFADLAGMTLDDFRAQARKHRAQIFEIIQQVLRGGGGFSPENIRRIMIKIAEMTGTTLQVAGALLLHRMANTSEQEEKIVAKLDSKGYAQKAGSQLSLLSTQRQTDMSNYRSVQDAVHEMWQFVKSLADQGGQAVQLAAWR